MKNIVVLFSFICISCFAQEDVSEFSNNTISLGVIVSDLEKSLIFYQDIIGMEETGGFSLDADFGKSSGLTGGVPFDVKILKLVNDDGASEFKIMSFGKPLSPSDNFIQDKNGVRYITIFPKSVAPIIDKIKANNIKLLGNTPIKLGDGRTFVLIQDPDGLFVELIGNL